jgi:hypothetical protein
MNVLCGIGWARVAAVVGEANVRLRRTLSERELSERERAADTTARRRQADRRGGDRMNVLGGLR